MDRYYTHISSFASTLGERGIRFENVGGKLKKVDGIVVVGMGGSGLPGEILKGVREEVGIRVPIVLVRDYEIPRITFKNPLYVFVSFSGETEEVIAAFLSVSRRAKKAVVTGGGRLLSLAMRENVPLAKFEQGGYAPRQATGIMFYGIAGIVRRLIPRVKIREYAQVIDSRSYEKKAAVLAKLLKNKILLVYSASGYKFLAYNWKIRFNENAKVPSFCNVLPEIDHNEIAGFESKKTAPLFFAIFLSDAGIEGARIRKRMHLTRRVLKKYGVDSMKIDLLGRTRLEKVWNAILYAEWMSYFLAKYKHVDPFDTELIEAFKKLMKG